MIFLFDWQCLQPSRVLLHWLADYINPYRDKFIISLISSSWLKKFHTKIWFCLHKKEDKQFDNSLKLNTWLFKHVIRWPIGWWEIRYWVIKWVICANNLRGILSRKQLDISKYVFSLRSSVRYCIFDVLGQLPFHHEIDIIVCTHFSIPISQRNILIYYN